MRWRNAMERALYGPDGFFIRNQPAHHFRTSAHSPLFAKAIARLVDNLDNALGRPKRLDIVDVGAGGCELLTLLEPLVTSRAKLVAVEIGQAVPAQVEGVLLATELLDNIPLDLAQDGHYLYDGAPLSDADAAWVQRWWDADYVEIGRTRDDTWAELVGKVRRGLALTVDYGHLAGMRPVSPTVTGFRAGREVEPQLDGSTDITCHVAMDSVADAGRSAAGGTAYQILKQRQALKALGVDGARPPLELAHLDPVGYLRALADASAAAELLNPEGLGGHWWLLQPVGSFAWESLSAASQQGDCRGPYAYDVLCDS